MSYLFQMLIPSLKIFQSEAFGYCSGPFLYNFCTNFFRFVQLTIAYLSFCVCFFFRFIIKIGIGQNLVEPKLTENKTLDAETIHRLFSHKSNFILSPWNDILCYLKLLPLLLVIAFQICTSILLSITFEH